MFEDVDPLPLWDPSPLGASVPAGLVSAALRVSGPMVSGPDVAESADDESAGGEPADPPRSALAATAPGPELAGLLARLDVGTLSGYDLVDFLGAARRLVSWAESLELAATAELGRRRPAFGDPLAPADPDERATCHPLAEVSEFAADEIAAELRISRRAAEGRLALAVDLDRLPGTRLALAAGRIDLAKARAIADAVAALADDPAQQVEGRVLARAPQQTVPRLRESLRRAVLAADPTAAQTRLDQQTAGRRVELVSLADGMAGIWAVLPAPDALAYYEGLTALAEKAKGPGDPRSLDQRRADVLGDLGGQLLARPDLPRRHGRRPHLQVTVAATTLLGLDDDPGELAGYGPIPAEVARRIAADATWRRLLTDPVSGALLDYGTTVYRAPRPLADHVLTRDRTCRGPGCRIPAARCDLDHTVEFPFGPTAAHNLGCKCRHCHRLKHQAGWTDRQLPDGALEWTTPTGHSYTVPPDPVLDPAPPPDPDPPPEDPPPF